VVGGDYHKRGDGDDDDNPEGKGEIKAINLFFFLDLVGFLEECMDGSQLTVEICSLRQILKNMVESVLLKECSRYTEEIPYLESKDKYHNNRRDRLTENAIRRYAETNPEYLKVLKKYYRPDKKLPRKPDNSKESIDKSIANKSVEAPKCSDSHCCLENGTTERLCPKCRQKFYIAKKKQGTKTIDKEQKDNDVTYFKTKIDDDHLPSFPPRLPDECTSLILPAMFTDEERKYYQSKQPKYPPVEKITAVLENVGKSKPNGNYNIITGEELFEL